MMITKIMDKYGAVDAAVNDTIKAATDAELYRQQLLRNGMVETLQLFFLRDLQRAVANAFQREHRLKLELREMLRNYRSGR